MSSPPLSDVTRANARILTTAQALGGASPAIIVSLGGIVGQQLASNPAFATLPISLYNLGMAIGTLPAAFLMRKYGRRGGYMIGAMLGILSGLVAASGIYMGAFLIFCLGTLTAGFYGSYVQSYRFAAVDGVPEAHRPKLISMVMIGGLFAAIIGPQTVIWTRDAIVWAPFAGSFVGQAVLAVIALPFIMRLRSVVTPPPPSGVSQAGRSLSEIAAQPRFVVAVVAGIVSYGLMSFVMTAAPIAMVGCGHTIGEAALGIQWHVLAMYGPSFITGKLIERFGKSTITSIGLILIALSAAVGLSGLGLTHFWLALVLLGIGWNFGFVGATAMVTDCYRPEERTRVQAMNDFLVFGAVAASSFSSGKLLSVAGWELINQMVFPIVGVVLLLIWWQAARNHRQARAA